MLDELVCNSNLNGSSLKTKSWLTQYTTLLNQCGSSYEEMQQIFRTKNLMAWNNFLQKVTTNLINDDLNTAQMSNTYQYYVQPLITHSPPRYTTTVAPAHKKT